MKYLIFLISVVILLASEVKAQENLFESDDDDISDTERSLNLNFIFAQMGQSLSLESASNFMYVLRGCRKIDINPLKLPTTFFTIKINENLNYSILYSVDLNKEGKITNMAYIGFMKKQYGETSEHQLYLLKKTRLYPKNNIYTEKITLSNGTELIIEERYYIKKITFPNGQAILIDKYYLEDCD